MCFFKSFIYIYIFSLIAKSRNGNNLLKTLDLKISKAQTEKRLNTKPCDKPTKMDERKWQDFSSFDYLNDFAVPLDYPGDKKETNEEDEDVHIPTSKAWGKITEHFPPRLNNREHEDERNLKDTNLPIGE